MGYLQRASNNSEGVHVANGPRYSASVTPAYPTRGMSRSPNLRGFYNGSPLGCHVTSTSYRPSRSCGVRLEDRHVFLSAFDLLAGCGKTEQGSRSDSDPFTWGFGYVHGQNEFFRSLLRAPGWTIREIPFC